MAAPGGCAVHERLKSLEVACGQGPRLEFRLHDGEEPARGRVTGLLREDHGGDLGKDVRLGHPAGPFQCVEGIGIKGRVSREGEIAQHLAQEVGSPGGFLVKSRLVEGEREVVAPGVSPLGGHGGIEDDEENGDRDPGLPVTELRGGQDEERKDGEDQSEIR